MFDAGTTSASGAQPGWEGSTLWPALTGETLARRPMPPPRFPHAPEPIIVVPIRWFVPVPGRRPHVLWVVIPRAAAKHRSGRTPLYYPSNLPRRHFFPLFVGELPRPEQEDEKGKRKKHQVKSRTHRKPPSRARTAGPFQLRNGARTCPGPTAQEPPRSTRGSDPC